MKQLLWSSAVFIRWSLSEAPPEIHADSRKVVHIQVQYVVEGIYCLKQEASDTVSCATIWYHWILAIYTGALLEAAQRPGGELCLQDKVPSAAQSIKQAIHVIHAHAQSQKWCHWLQSETH